MTITSRGNPAVKAIRSLRNRKDRERTGLAYVEGIRAAAEALHAGIEVESVVYAPELLSSRFGLDLVRLFRDRGVRGLEVSADVFRSLALKENPQGLGVVVHQRWERLEDVIPREPGLWVALDGVQDPGNLGTILRTSDAVAAAGVILTGASTDPYDPTCIRASTGALFSQRLVRSTFEDLIRWAHRHGCSVVGSSGAASREYRSIAYPLPMVLLMGSEREGLSKEQRAACDLVVGIPMAGRSDSLNLAVATGLLLYEVFHQHRDLLTTNSCESSR